MCVLNDPDRLDEVLEKWEGAGIRGATIVESTGLYRRRARQEGNKRVPLHFSFGSLQAHKLEDHYTLFVIVESAAQVERCIQATESLVGNLDEPNTGVLAAWPLEFVKGVPGPKIAGEVT
jgi:hypothetical protein